MKTSTFYGNLYAFVYPAKIPFTPRGLYGTLGEEVSMEHLEKPWFKGYPLPMCKRSASKGTTAMDPRFHLTTTINFCFECYLKFIFFMRYPLTAFKGRDLKNVVKSDVQDKSVWKNYFF